MYRLFTAPNSYALIAHAVLEELGVAYELKWVKIFTDNPDPAFLAASPHARVPALVHEHGTLHEAGAIALYLAERHPEAGLTIPIGEPGRGKFLQWLSYLASTLQPDVMIQFHPEIYVADAKDQAKLKRASMKRLGRVLDILDEALDPGPYFFADRLTVCDFVLALQATWPEIYPGSIDDYRNVKRLVERVTERPSVRRVLAQHGLDRANGS
ncbi:MAG: glutathione S-transferase family protein [Kiloniellales bacterium]|nr:glutathione S-transferase family protein [Kiloniellales bacterium]